MKKLLHFVFWILLSFFSSLWSQTTQANWHPGSSVRLDLQLFKSQQSINLPTAETLQKGDFEFEISHRFIPPIGVEKKNILGMDGPVNMRVGFGWAVSNKMVITIGRSNVTDNYDFQLKYKALQLRHRLFPTLIAFNGGVAWNTQVLGRKATDGKNFQYFGRFIINTLFKKKIGLGVVPSFLYNSTIYCKKNQTSFTFGSYVQFYASRSFSFIAEWNPTIDGWRNRYNPVALGFELETGGHFFKIVFTNSSVLNPSQYLAGADRTVADNDWRLGFNITRLLKFKKQY